MFFSKRHRLRTLLAVAGFFCLGLYSLRQSSASRSRPELPESVSLAEFMNGVKSGGRADWVSQPIVASKSSFNWSAAIFEHLPPQNPTTLPRGNSKRQLAPVQHMFTEEPLEAAMLRVKRRGEVRSVFASDWNNYRQRAWKKDSFRPKSGTAPDQSSGWAAAVIDSLDTLWIMGFREDFDEAVAAVAQIDFGVTTYSHINTFDTTNRYLGGLLGAYELSGREALLTKATELGDMVYAAFNTETYMPVDYMEFERVKGGFGLRIEDWVVSGAPGSLSLEMTRLSQITGDSKYYDAITRVMRLYHEHQKTTRMPGLWPLWASMKSLDVDGRREFTLGDGQDTLYEYLPKMIALLGGSEPMYETMTRSFISAATNHMFFRPMLPGGEDVLMAGSANVNPSGHAPLEPVTEHLTCYIGGTVALAGKLLDDPGHVAMGARLAMGCAYMYGAFQSGIMPERVAMVMCEPKRASVCEWNEGKWMIEQQQHQEWKDRAPKGFTSVLDTRHLLRPEAIESIFYLYRITGDRGYQDMAWKMFEAVTKASKTTYGHANVRDVTAAIDQSKQQDNLEDSMEASWFAETLKYYYLIFSPPDIISLDDFVLNTKAHPLRRPV